MRLELHIKVDIFSERSIPEQIMERLNKRLTSCKWILNRGRDLLKYGEQQGQDDSGEGCSPWALVRLNFRFFKIWFYYYQFVFVSKRLRSYRYSSFEIFDESNMPFTAI